MINHLQKLVLLISNAYESASKHYTEFWIRISKKKLWKRSLINENNLYLKTWTTTAKKTATAKHWQWNVFFFFFRLNSERSKEQPWFHHWITRGRQQMQLPVTMANGLCCAHQLSAHKDSWAGTAHAVPTFFLVQPSVTVGRVQNTNFFFYVLKRVYVSNVFYSSPRV